MSEPASVPQRVVFRSGGGAVWMWVVAIVTALLLGDLLIRGTPGQAALVVPWLLLIVWFVYAFLYAPRIVATPAGVAVRNVLKTTHLSWGAIETVQARWQIEFRMSDEAGGGTLQAWGAPAGRPARSARREHPSMVQLERLRVMREEADPQPATRSTAWDVPGIVAGVLIAVWLIVSIAITL